MNKNLNAIATIAKGRKFSRDECLAAILEIAATENWDEHVLIRLSVLYGYFSQKPSGTPKFPEKWVAQAMAVKDSRFYLNYIYSDGSRIIATDGGRMHVYETDKYSVGYYDKRLCPVGVDAEYPDIDRIIKNAGKGESVSVSNHTVVHATVCGNKFIPAYDFGDAHVFNSRYFDQATAHPKFDTVQLGGKGDACQMGSGPYTAVIMPIRL